MKFFKNIFSTQKKEPTNEIKTYADFWNWFEFHENSFFKTIDSQNNVVSDFLDKILPQLKSIDKNYWVLCGMYSDKIAELIITADGQIESFYRVEELINEAPKLKNWKFTTHKPEQDIENCKIEMSGYVFDQEHLSFYNQDSKDYPDEIDIVVTHQEITDDNYDEVANGIYIFLDNYLGELKFAETIDSLTIRERKENEDFIPIGKLKDYLLWREKEFIEKYDGIRFHTENDHYTSFEGESKDKGLPLFALINSDLLNWNSKASHPWFMKIEIEYNGTENNGLPYEKDYELLNEIENEINKKLADKKGYLNIGRETGDNTRNIYFANVEYRLPAKVMDEIQYIYDSYFKINFSIYKDKYWMTLKKFE